MTPEEADALLRGLCWFTDMYEDRREEMPTDIASVARVAFTMGNQGAIARNDRSVIVAAQEVAVAKEEEA